MATVAGPLRPDQPFASMLTAAFNQAPTFISQTKITVPSDDEKGMPEDVLKDKFILNDKCFVDLQVYLKSAMRLPTSNDNFKRVFPAEWFAEYFETDKAAPKLYDVSDLALRPQSGRHADYLHSICNRPLLASTTTVSNFGEIQWVPWCPLVSRSVRCFRWTCIDPT